LMKVEAAPPDGGGWARHLSYDRQGQGLIAFGDIHDDGNVPAGCETSLSAGLGLPIWTNHLAFDAGDRDGIEVHKRRWLDHGHDVAEIDHGWCTSIYAVDPNGTLVEFCATTKAFTAADREDAQRMLTATKPPLKEAPAPTFHEAQKTVANT